MPDLPVEHEMRDNLSLPTVTTVYRVGGLTLALHERAVDAESVEALPASYNVFRADPSTAAPNIVVWARRGPIEPPTADSNSVRCETAQWVSYRSSGRQVFLFKAASTTSSPWRIAIGESDGAHWNVTTAPDLPVSPPMTRHPSPLAFPLAELVSLDVLSAQGGLLFHSCGVRDGGNGLLFCGRSGRGKSTIGRLWADDGTTILSDDRVLLSSSPGEHTIHGTPWHGDLQRVAAAQAPLRAVFFLEHAESTVINKIEPTEACRRLLSTLWQPIWIGQDRLRTTWENCARLAREVPTYTLAFRPDSTALQQVRRTVAELPGVTEH